MAAAKRASADYVKRFNKFLAELHGESDRAAVILGAANLDLLLYQILQKKLVPLPSGQDDLLDGDRPLGTFSSRIKMCYRLGLITPDLARALHLVRRIRNSFAHELSTAKLDTGAHADRVRELVAPLANSEGLKWVSRKAQPGVSTASKDFRAVVALLSARLEGVLQRCKPLDNSDAQPIVPFAFQGGGPSERKST